MSERLWDYEAAFKPATDIRHAVVDVYAEVRCPCGQDIILCEGGDTKRCDCGKVYRLQCYVEVAA